MNTPSSKPAGLARRAFLSAAAMALPAVAALPVASTAAQRPDAELIDLGGQLDVLVQRYNSGCARLRPFYDKHQALMDSWFKEHPKSPPAEATKAYNRFAEEIGLLTAEKSKPHPDDIMIEMDPVANAITAIPALTMAGLSVKARLAKFGASDYWAESDKEVDWDKLLVRKLVDAVIHAAAAA
jgi:hypothetical protein